jgi:dihydrofolate reductase
LTEPHIALIAAVACNGVIGRDNRLIWRISSDLRRFKALTMGKPLVMGRKTFESLPPGGLPGRTLIVVTRDAKFGALGAILTYSVDEALAVAEQEAARLGVDEIMVIGGGEIYRQTLAKADRLYITEVDVAPEGDALFPAIDENQWRAVRREAGLRSPNDEADYSLVDYVRIQKAS